MFDTVMSWLPWLLIPGGLLGLLSWGLGLPAVLSMLATAFEIVAPLLKAAVSAVVEVASWVWRVVLWPGLKGMLDGIPQAITFAAIVAVGVLFVKIHLDLTLKAKNKEVTVCVQEVRKLRQTAASLQKQLRNTSQPFRWPWE